MQIPEFTLDSDISLNDKLLGSDAENNFKTKNFELGAVFNLFQQSLSVNNGGQTKLNDGTNTQVTGTGIVTDPYRINVVGLGDDTMIAEGTNITVTGSGTVADPYLISTSEAQESTKINAGTNISVTGDGTTASPFLITGNVDAPIAPQDTIKGRLTAGTGLTEDLTPLQVRSLLEAESTQQLNTRDTANRNRANHTGTQLAATISDLAAAVDARPNYNSSDWDIASDKSVQSLGFNTLNGLLNIGLKDSTTYSQTIDGRYLQTLTQGTGISIDLTDPVRPVVSLSGGGGETTIENYFNNSFYDIGGDTLTGPVNGTNTAFSTSQGEFRAGTVRVYVNGQLMFDGSGISEGDPGTGYIVFDTAPIATDDILVAYEVGTLEAGQVGTGDMLAANNLSDLDSVATARQNLGLGPIALLSEVATGNILDTSVTNPKLANMAANTFKGRVSTNGPVQDLTAAQLRTASQTESVTELDARGTVDRNRANHTGVQAIASITDLQNQLDGKLAETAQAVDSVLFDGLVSGQFLRSDVSTVLTGTLRIDAAEGLILRGLGTGIANSAYMSFEDSAAARQGYVGFPNTASNELHLFNDTSGKSLILKEDGTLTYDGQEFTQQTSGTTTLTLTGLATTRTTTASWLKTGNLVTIALRFTNINSASTGNVKVTGLPYASATTQIASYFADFVGVDNGETFNAIGGYVVGTSFEPRMTNNGHKDTSPLSNVTFGAAGSFAATFTYITT